MQKARFPNIVAEACFPSEVTCEGTQDCCGKGEGCCMGFEVQEGETIVVSSCCPFGEDSVCCDDGTCCPFGHTCDGDACIGPSGVLIMNNLTRVRIKLDFHSFCLSKLIFSVSIIAFFGAEIKTE